MKNLYKLLTITALLLSTCTVYLNEQDAGTVAITIGGGGRTAAPERFGEIDLDDLEHTIQVLDKNGAEQYRAEKLRYGETRSITLPPGLYTFNIKAFYNDELKAEGREDRTIHSGKNPAITIKMEPVLATSKILTGITAEYEPTTAIFPDTTLLTLKEGLTVAAVYNDGSEKELEADEYELSGELTEGESVITVTYTEGSVTKTADFTVTVNAAHAHIYGAWYTHTPATCTEAGVEREDCTADPPHYNEREIPALGHDEGEWHITLEATCSATGIKELRCTRDNAVLETETIPIDSDAHDFGDWITTDPTCTTKGIDTRICSRDPAHKETRNETDIDPNAHAWQPLPSTATETTNGIEGRVCNNNHDHDVVTITYATGTDGLEFNLIDINGGTDNAYRVHNGGNRDFTAVHIPAFHREDVDSPYLPVTAISNGIDTPDNNAFGGTPASDPNTNLTTVTFAAESQLTTISNQAFRRCTSLISVTIPDSVESIGQAAFFQCSSLTSITIPDSVTSIANGVFTGCTSLTSITIPDSVESIGQAAFYNCTSLTGITIPDSVTSIGQTVFRECTSLASISIGAGVTSIGENAFQNCTNLRNIIIDNDKITSWLYIFTADNLSITFKKNPGIYAYGDYNSQHYKLTSLTIEEGVTSIGTNAFSRCANLASVTIPSSVTSIGNEAFRGCSSLPEIIIPDSVTSIGSQAFIGCSSLTSVTIGAGVTSIGSQAFYGCSSLTSVTIPASVTSIGSQAFYGCYSLASVTFAGMIPSGTFDAGAFWDFDDLRAKFYATDPDNGTPGTYLRSGSGTTADPYVWTKQP